MDLDAAVAMPGGAAIVRGGAVTASITRHNRDMGVREFLDARLIRKDETKNHQGQHARRGHPVPADGLETARACDERRSLDRHLCSSSACVAASYHIPLSRH